MGEFVRFLRASAQWAWGSWQRLQPIVGIPAALLQPPLSLIPTVILFVTLFPFAPYNLWKIQHARIRELEAERVPKLAVTPKGDRRHREHQGTEHLMWAELKIRNTSLSQSLHNVEVRVTSYTITQERQGRPGVYGFVYGVSEIQSSLVYWALRDAGQRRLAIDIPPGSERTSLIAFSDDPNGPPGFLNAPRPANCEPRRKAGS